MLREREDFTERETLPWKNTHMGLPEGNKAIWTPSPVKGMTGDKGLVSDGSVQSECQGCLPAHSSTDACQKGVVHQCIGGGNTP